jgi:hypothetical protein
MPRQEQLRKDQNSSSRRQGEDAMSYLTNEAIRQAQNVSNGFPDEDINTLLDEIDDALASNTILKDIK